jgi:CheY-like chemotaxis protein
MNDVNDMREPQSPTALAHERAQRDFRANLNHKLRTPLNAIIGFTELLTLQPSATRKDTDLQQILKSAREMLGIIEHELGEPGDRNHAIATAEAVPLLTACDVLYIEDDDVNFTLVQRILELRPGLELMHAAYGRLGVEMAEAYQPKLILLDLNLPDMHGADVLQMLQRHSVTAHIPVVILSANATPSQIERLLTAGARNYLTKPFNLDPFLAVVDEFTATANARAA